MKKIPRQKRIWWLWIGTGLLAVAVYIFYTELRPVVIFGLGDHFARAIPHQVVPEGIPSLRAEDCGTCHEAIYEEWKSSIHSQSFVDPFFQAYWRKDKKTWICLNCHTPLENQQPQLVLDVPRKRVEKAVLEPNPRYDPDLQHQGVTCAACHVRDGVILGPFDDSVAPHPTRYDPIYRTTDLCQRCHEVPSGPFQFYGFGPCGTYPEFEGGHYFTQGYICQTCHMPEIERPVAKGGPVRKGRQHLWRGGHDPEQLKRAITVQLRSDTPDLNPDSMADFTLTLTNSGAGHYLPTGDPDRYFTIDLEILNGNGEVLKGRSDEMGRWIIWQPVIVEVHDNRLEPLASRDYTLRYRLPASLEAFRGWELRAVVRYHIMTEKSHRMLRKKYGLTGDDPYVFTLFEEVIPLTAPFPEVIQAGPAPPRPFQPDTLACRMDGQDSGGEANSVPDPGRSG